jgi:acyl carrier protein
VVDGADHCFAVYFWIVACFCKHFSPCTLYLHNFLIEIMDKLKEVFSKILNISTENVKDDLSPKNTPTWDSLNSIILITEIEKAFQMTFSYDEAMSVKNFSEVVSLLKSKGISL